jgi:hypothetical protein
MRPGYLRSASYMKNKNTAKPFRGLGGFGKGAMVPPPSATPSTAAGPATYQGGKWVCQGVEPQPEADGYWTCCPSGWKKTPFSDNVPCKGEEGLVTCGPLPEGMDPAQTKCCVDQRQWTAISDPSADPCSLIKGRQGPITSEDILAPELEIEREPVITPKMMIAGGIVAVTLIGLALLAR